MADQCALVVKKAVNDLSDAEIDDLLSTLRERKAYRKAHSELESLEQGLLDDADNLASDAVEAAQIERRNRLINIKRRAEIMQTVARADQEFGDPSLGLQAAMVGTTRVFEGSRRSVDARAQALFTEYGGGLVADLKQAGVLAYFNSRQNQRAIARELEQITKPNGKPGITGIKEAKAIADVIDKYRKASISRVNRAGAWIKPLPGYIIRQTHDMGKVRRAGFEAWRDFIMPLLDEQQTYDGADPEKFLRAAYDGIKSGVHLKHDAAEIDLKLAFKGPGNLAKRISQKRVLHFKDADSFMDYNEKYGTRGLSEAVVHDLDRMARSTAIMETFGPNPRAMFDGIMQDLKEKYRADDKKFDRLKRQSLEWQFHQIDGTARIPVNPTMAHVASSVRAVQSLSKLGGAALSSITDVAFHSTELHSQGIPLLESWGRTLQNYMAGFSRGEKAHVADLIGVGLEGQIGDISSRFDPTDSLPGKISKTQQLFFKLNMLGPWTDANKRGLGLMMARHLAQHKATDWADLPEHMTRMMGRYGIGEQEWHIARQAVKEAPNGTEYLMPSEIKNLPDSAFGDLKPREIQRLKDDIETGIRSYIVDRADFAAPTPGARERAMVTRNMKPGTVDGEAMKFVAQFKTFSISVLTKNFGEMIYGGGAKNLSEALLSGKGDMLGLANLIVGSTLLGYLAMTAKDLAKGRTPRDPRNASTWQASLLQGGGLGIYGDFFLGQTNRFGNSLLSTLAGPTLGTISDVDQIRAAIMAGDPWGAKAFHTVLNNIPFINLFYTRVALDYLVLYDLQERVSPGYLHRTEQRMKRENNQEFILPPSKLIPRGGGDSIFAGVENN